jgi:hypothetical protein
MADVAQLRKRVRAAIDAARREDTERKTRTAEATRAYEVFLDTIAIPAARQVAMALRAEGVPIDVTTPSGAVRLVSERRRGDGVEISLDGGTDPPSVLVTITRMRGSRHLQADRPLKSEAPIAALTEDDVIEMFLEVLKPWL